MSTALIIRPKYEISRPFTDGPWTRFHDMHSGGGQKLDWGMIYIQAPQEEAERVFYARFKRNPNKVTCTCCGPDYSIDESSDLYQATGFERGCGWADDKYTETSGDSKYALNEYITLDEYVAKGKNGPRGNTAHFIAKSDILDDERRAKVPQQGYVWVDNMYDVDE